jgi:hypothetical protein
MLVLFFTELEASCFDYAQSRTQSNACARARMALALGKLNFSCAVIGLTCMPTKPERLSLGVPVVNFPRANAILARAQALLWVRDWVSGYEIIFFARM